MATQQNSSSNSAENLKQQGNDAFKQKDYARALNLYTKALQTNPRDQKLRATLHANRAQVYLVQKEYTKTIEEATKAIDLDHQNAKAYFRRADARMKIGEYETALFDYRMVRQIDPRIEVRQQMREAYQKNREAKRKDYYKILGVKKDASPQEIKKQYQKLAKKLHPDKCKDPAQKEAKTKQFQEVKEAYEKLKDPESRRRHDLGQDDNAGPSGMEEEFDGQGADFGDVFKVFTHGGPFGFATASGADGFFTHMSGGGGGGRGAAGGGHGMGNDEMFSSIFEQFFAGMGGGANMRRGANMRQGAATAAGGPGGAHQFF